jgi:hypothetical protein
MNDWRKQRDLLIEETMIFAQRVGSDAPKQFGFRNNVSQPLTPVVGPQPEQLPMATEVPIPKDRLDTERDVVQRRLANFKATQKKFQQEREEYYARTMSDARATQWTLRSPDNGI